MKTERSNIKFPLWRKKVDSTILKNACTPLPGWAINMWGIETQFGNIVSKKESGARVDIFFKRKIHAGFIARSKRSQKGSLYRLFISADLCEELKKVYIMSYMRSVESYLREGKNYQQEIEKDIPFWEFLDIEYDSFNRTFYFTAYYIQDPIFPELFKSLVKSTVLKQFENEDEDLNFTKSDWLPRNQSFEQINANNVIYYLIDTKNKLFYIGEADKMHRRFEQGHLGMPTWDYFRYDILPKGFSKKQRVALERMLIRCFATILNNNNGIYSKNISDFKLTNIKIDL